MNQKNNGIGTIAFAYFSNQISRSDAIKYWRGNHGWLVSQQEGCTTYRQLKFDDNPLIHIPTWKADMHPNKDFIPDGAAENFVPTYMRAVKVMLSDNKKKIYLDERNFLRQVFMYTTTKENCIWLKDDLNYYNDETGIADGERILLCFKGKGIKNLVLKELAQLAMSDKKLKEIHAYSFMKYNENLWKSVDINHTQPKSEEYQGALLLGADNRQSIIDFLSSDIVSNIVNKSKTKAIYALNIEAVTIMRQDDKRSQKAINGKSGR